MADIFFNGELRPQASTKPETTPITSQLTTAVTAAKARANHTGTQLAATISDLPAFVQAYIDAVIDAAPGALDTLNKLAAALGDDPNFATTINNLYAALDTRVDVLEAAVTPRQMTALLGDGVATSFNVDHGWGLADRTKVEVTVVNTITGETEFAGVARTTVNRVVVDFGASPAPAVGQYRVLLREYL